MRRKKLIFIICFLVIFFLASVCQAGEIKRTHRFLRPMAMGEAFTAVADYMDTIAYNPAGVYIDHVEWSMAFPLLWLGYSDTVKKAIDGELTFEGESSFSDLPGTRVYIEQQLGFPFVFIPSAGIFFGISTDNWMKFVVPKQTILPVVHLEIVNQNVIEYAMALEPFNWNFNVGVNIKAIKRTGIIEDFNLLNLTKYNVPKTDENGDPVLDSEGNPVKEFDGDAFLSDYELDNIDPNPLNGKIAYDLGFLYHFDHRLNPRIGLAFMDVGGVDYGAAGVVKQFNSIGAAITQEIKNISLTYSADYHDFTYSYFSNDSIKRRIALGFEAAMGKNADNTSLFALQLGLKELELPSFGLSFNVGYLEFSQAVWTENFGTEKNPVLDTRYMLLFNIIF